MDTKQKTRENRVRRAAKRQGYIIRKSRSPYVFPLNIDNHGGYMVINAFHNAIVAGIKYDMTLDDVEEFFEVT